MIAQSTCGGLSEKEGWVYAVRRPCKGNTTCEQICESKELSAQDPQIKDRTLVINIQIIIIKFNQISFFFSWLDRKL